MKFNSFSASLFALNAYLFAPNTVQSLKCGSAITKDCIGDTDVRYDSDASTNLVDQANTSKIIPGLYIGDYYFYDSAGEPMKQDPTGLEFFPSKLFLKIIVTGSRYHIRTYYVANNAYLNFPGACLKADAWYTSTFEKDGSAQMLGTRTYQDNHNVFKVTTSENKLTPVNDQTIYGSAEDSTVGQFYQGSYT